MPEPAKHVSPRHTSDTIQGKGLAAATPALGRVYRSKVAVVHEALAYEASRDEAFELIRSLGPRAPLDVRRRS